jgi:hypothetical protein
MEKEKDEVTPESADIVETELDDLLPTMNVNAGGPVDRRQPALIEDEQLLGVYQEIMDDLREDRKEVDQLLANFVDMVFNDGDPSTASKEAVVNLAKIKSDLADKKAKVADLMTRIKLKERWDQLPRYLAAKQENNVYLGGEFNKRKLIGEINKAKKRNKSQ